MAKFVACHNEFDNNKHFQTDMYNNGTKYMRYATHK